MQVFSAYWIPALVALFTLAAMGLWPSLYPASSGRVLAFQALEDATGQWDVAQAQQALAQAQPPQAERLDTRLSQAPFWVRLPAPGGAGTLEFPSRHASALACWHADTLAPLGRIDRTQAQSGWRVSRAGFALDVAPDTPLLCRASFIGPARFSVKAWAPAELAVREQEFHRNSGLLDGGVLVLALFTLIAGFINHNRNYLVFAAWLVVNLRMAALSMGWDHQWLGQTIPFAWLVWMRPLTLALYFLATVVLFRALFEQDLAKAGVDTWVRRVQWLSVPLVALALVLPYGRFLPIIWVCTALGTAVLVYSLTRLLIRTHSRVAMWYAASITVALFASLYEVAAAALGLKGLLGAVNSVTAALASSLLASLAIAEQMRQEHQERLAAQEELSHAYEVIPIGLFTLDLQGHWLSANPALLQMLGTASLSPTADRWATQFSEDAWQQLLRRTQGGTPVELDLEVEPPGQPVKRFLVKATLARDKIEGSLQDITEKARATEHLQFLADHDTLTKVLNRRGIEAMLLRGLVRLGRGRPLSVAYLDLDRFKLINDLYGHAAGDVVLQEVCARAQAPLGPHMHLGRVGGDEFLLVMIDTPLHRAEAICREIVASLARSPCQVGDRAFQVRGSIGLIEVGAGAQAKDIVSTADHACRQAKKAQPCGLVVFEQGSRVFTEHEAELQLIERLASNQRIDGLFLEMQPILSLHTPHASLNFEVLLRMQDEHGDRVPTERLIHAGENAGRMGVIDRWVLHHTLEWMEQHLDALAHTQFVCLNLSGASLNDERFMEDVFALLDSKRDLARRICLEITESVALHDMGNTRRFIDKVRSFGARVALDDFGAGYTSFSYLKDLPADLLKIDGSFIVNMNRHPANIAIVEAIVSLAQNLGMKTIAEWAEDFETVETLAEIGVDYVQGFVVARPQNPALLLEATSGADFIRDERLRQYLSTLAPDDEMGHVDLVLG
ncbi:bifunctional diguanylate cyclase/phosphodiesterase, partial [Aquabacterium sp. A08]|uniref:putative bifunctional diguanylate cyclase/phosphodiesterase n=1 Tax=Aquabacterium sp. A08 TaxID=2718532 RepID=UPI00141F89C7